MIVCAKVTFYDELNEDTNSTSISENIAFTLDEPYTFEHAAAIIEYYYGDTLIAIEKFNILDESFIFLTDETFDKLLKAQSGDTI